MLFPGSRDDGITGRFVAASEQAACQRVWQPPKIETHQTVLTGSDGFGCHHRPAITTPCEAILRPPVRCSPPTPTYSKRPSLTDRLLATPTLPGLTVPSS